MPTLNTEIERPPATVEKLQAENDELRLRLQEAEETIAAIRSGAVDALVVEEPTGHRIYTLEGADRPYRLFVEEMQQGAATLHVDGTIAWCNRQLAEMLKTSPEKLIGVALHDFVSPESRVVYQNLVWQGQTRSGRGELHLRRADGGEVPAFLTFNALPKDCGAAIGVLVTDQTSLRHHQQLTAAHAALRESEHLKAAILNSSLDAIMSIDSAGLIVEFNPEAERMFGHRAAEVIGRPLAEVIIPERLRAAHNTGLAHYLATGEDRVLSSRTEMSALRADGTEFPVEISLTRISGIEPPRFSGFIRDITERKRAEEALRQSHTELEQHAEELSRFNRVAVGRELRMIDLKKEINELASRLGEPPRYPVDSEQESKA